MPDVFVGDEATITATFKLNGTNTSPTTVTSQVQDPDGAETTPSLTSAVAGIFSMTLALNLSGSWKIKVNGTGIVEKGLFSIINVTKTVFD